MSLKAGTGSGNNVQRRGSDGALINRPLALHPLIARDPASPKDDYKPGGALQNPDSL